MKKVTSIEYIGEQEVYDMTVEDNHNYVVAGTVLHNCDYQGNLVINLWNRSDKPITINRGDRVAQFVVMPIVQYEFLEVTEFHSETDRGQNGFGSTGK